MVSPFLSIVPKAEELGILVKELKLDILVLIEVKLDKPDEFPVPAGYQLVCNCRNRMGGGIAFVAKVNISLRNLDVPDIHESENCETLAADVYLTGSFQFKLTGVYIPDGYRTWSVSKVLEKLTDCKSVLCGDFNAHDPDLPEIAVRVANSSGKRVCEMIRNSDDICLLSKGLPTHVNGAQTDLWFCSKNMNSASQPVARVPPSGTIMIS